MLRMPNEMHVQLIDTRGRALEVANILIGINTLVEGRYYYGNLVGLTDRTGSATASGPSIERDFHRDRASYPMDYRIDLDQCDDELEFLILSPEELEEARSAVSDDFTINAQVRESYARALNQLVKPALKRVRVVNADSVLRAQLTTERVNP